MTASNPKREFAVEVVRRLRDAGFQAFWAGGCVRDLLLGREPEDYDVATSARPEDVQRLFGRRRTLAVGASFGVIIVRGLRGAGQVEVATFRTEGAYLDGRRPESVAFSTPEEDAARRDFTINGMFYDPLDDQVRDYVGGQRDLDAGIVRAIGDPRARMSEDKLRMLRAARFAATLGFTLDEPTAAAVRDMASQLLVVSAERIAHELRRMLVHPQRRQAMESCVETNLLPVIVPELTPVLPPPCPVDGAGDFSLWTRVLAMLELLEAPSFPLVLATLLHVLPPGEPIAEAHSPEALPVDPLLRSWDEQQRVADLARIVCRRLRLSNDETGHAIWLLTHQRDLDDAPRASPAKLKRLLAHGHSGDLVKLLSCESQAARRDHAGLRCVEQFLRDTPPEKLDPPHLATGHNLIALGLRPGPRFKQILDAVRDAQLNGEITTREQALERARALIEESDQTG